MTVCIGAICDEGKAVVVAADKMVTFGPPMMLQTEPSAFSKITSLGPQCVVLFAGSVPDGEEVVSRTIPRLAGQTKPPVAAVAEAVRASYPGQKKGPREGSILRPLLGGDFSPFQVLVSQTSA